MDRKKERIAVDELHKTVTKTADIVKIDWCKPASVCGAVKRFNENERIDDRPRKGRSTTSSTPENTQNIRYKVQRNSERSIHKLAREARD
ncbi:hypothetical protein KIN20_002810 [Parelaphostrongylus tenuis]|uniref:Uncharacterized protein n=1 Tax=Parelaphostrongylus tenuis TaxID=148309 RepID=A0AAD5QD81_PARTN|nr:hypothetical protein KIN20_002810 [Parelaphostrongylus tenuis]